VGAVAKEEVNVVVNVVATDDTYIPRRYFKLSSRDLHYNNSQSVIVLLTIAMAQNLLP